LIGADGADMAGPGRRRQA